MRLLRRAHCIEALRHRALEIGVSSVDFRIDHRDRHIGALGYPVDVGNLELLQDVLRGIAWLSSIAARRWRASSRFLLQGIHVIWLRDRDQLDGSERPDDLNGAPPVADAEA